MNNADKEREDCAVIADNYAARAWAAYPPAQEAAVAAQHIAASIRGRSTGDYRSFNFTEHLAQWMIKNGFATGHGDDFVSLLDELEWQIDELRKK